MKAVVVREVGKVGVEEVAEPEISAGQLLVKIEACSICSSTDVHIVEGEDPYAKLPCILGHESVGEVVKVGAEVDGFAVGDRVVGGASGGLRPDGLYSCYGSMAEYGIASPLRAPKLPASLVAEDAVLAFQAAECIHGVRIAQIESTDKVVILGQGSIGLIFTQLAGERWADQIIAVDLLESRLDVSRRLGADFTIDASLVDPVEEVLSLTGGLGADVVIEAAGVPESFRQSFKMVRPGGKILVFGYHVKPVDRFEAIEFYYREPRVFGVRGFGLTPAIGLENLTIAVRLLLEKRLLSEGLVTHVLPLSKAEQGFMHVGDKSAIKVVLKP
ncbi:MAG: zinc-binding dehydrogenase [Candidatus Bathyarchaeota archaeon]|nr:MAG: zinc-binding dehydrogenase [Candidatus Bathyarchaeota archaeon]